MRENEKAARLKRMMDMKESGLTLEAIGKEFGITKQAVSSQLKKGIDIHKSRRCLYCGKPFVPRSTIREWCSPDHKRKWQTRERRQLRFFSNIDFNPDENGCLNWIGYKHPNGYGGMNGGYAHRLAWRIFRGEIPQGLCVLHHCDNPSCVNPAHLWLGTKGDNARDRNGKGRGKAYGGVGENCPQAKLCKKDVIRIKQMLKSGISRSSIGKSYGVGYGTIYNISVGKSWSHIKEGDGSGKE